MNKLPWHDKMDNPPTSEELIALYGMLGVYVYTPITTIDRGVQKWISLKEINEFYGTNWTAEEHCAALN